MIPVILYLLLIGYGLLIVSILFEKNMWLVQKMACFMLIIVSVNILINGIGTLTQNELIVVTTGIVTIGISAYHLIKDFDEILK